MLVIVIALLYFVEIKGYTENAEQRKVHCRYYNVVRYIYNIHALSLLPSAILHKEWFPCNTPVYAIHNIVNINRLFALIQSETVFLVLYPFL